MVNIHQGHRDRLRKRFLENGLDGFNDHEALELLLFYAVPRVDTNEIAHQLINKYKTLSGVFDASVDGLCETTGLSKNGAVLLKLVPQMLKLYNVDDSICTLDNIKSLKKYFLNEYMGVTSECLKVCCLSETLYPVVCATISKGDVNTVEFEPLKIVEAAIKYNSRNIIIAHNHPNGDCTPSDRDVVATRNLKRILNDLGINLLDHVIVSKRSAVSMKETGYFNLLDK